MDLKQMKRRTELHVDFANALLEHQLKLALPITDSSGLQWMIYNVDCTKPPNRSELAFHVSCVEPIFAASSEAYGLAMNLGPPDLEKWSGDQVQGLGSRRN